MKSERNRKSSPVQEKLKGYDSEIAEWSKNDSISQTQMWRLFKEAHPEVEVSLSTFKVYVLKHHRPKQVKHTVRVVTPPGQAQVDFGYVGYMLDPVKGKKRKTWAFVMTLSQSRHRFVRFVFSQDVSTWIDCHRRAFEFFGGVPQSILLDNLKSGVIQSDIYDPTLNRSYQECERHYGFVADPAKVYSPQHKGRVERVVPVVRGHLLAGREFKNIDEANQRALMWCREEIGQQIHGTTKQKPMELFEKTDKVNLIPLPKDPFEVSRWQSAKVAWDHHVVFEGAYYSVPTRFIGQIVDVRGSHQFVQIFHLGELIKTHLPVEKGTFQSDPYDYPEKERHYLLSTAKVCREKAQNMGESVEAIMQLLLKRETNRNLRKAQKILRLGEKHGSLRMNQVCQQALEYQTLSISFFEGAIQQSLPIEETVLTSSPPVPGFLRSSEYFSYG